MEDKEIKAYSDGFMNGLDVKENYKYQILGYPVEKMPDILGDHKKKENPTITPFPTKPTVHFDEWGIKLQTDPVLGLQLFVYEKLVYQYGK